jgi:hypothetical protein
MACEVYPGESIAFHTFSGQVAEFVRAYLDAPVSLKEIVDDIGQAGAGHNPAGLLRKQLGTETQYRYFMSKRIAMDCESYNSYFESTGVDMIIIPAAWAPTPDLAAVADSTVPQAITDENGQVKIENTASNSLFQDHNQRFKHLHIPKLSVPTGLTTDGRPTGIQLWGPAVPFDQIFDDNYAARHDAKFLYLAKRVAAALQLDPRLVRVDAPMMVRDLPLVHPRL